MKAVIRKPSMARNLFFAASIVQNPSRDAIAYFNSLYHKRKSIKKQNTVCHIMPKEDITKLKEEYSKRIPEIKSRLLEFKNNKDFFYELCFCILTPQSNAKKCYEAVQIIKKKDFKNKSIGIKPILKSRTRFYKNKSAYLNLLKFNFSNIKNNLNGNALKNREYLVKNVKGLSYKESSHCLRNVGYKDLAILDRHILKNLHNLNVIEKIPKTLNRKKYIEIESKFKSFSKRINISM